MRRALRRAVLERDEGVCSACALDCLDLQRRLDVLEGEALQVAWVALEAFGFNRGLALWEADHEEALEEGGADELENVVTRCRPCHKAKTAEHATRRATLRRLLGKKWAKDRARANKIRAAMRAAEGGKR